MPCPHPRRVRKALKNLPSAETVTLNYLSKLLSAASRRLPPPMTGGPKTLNFLSADDLLNLPPQNPNHSPTIFFFNTLINAFIVSNRRTEALDAFAHLKKNTGKRRTNFSCSIILKLQFILGADSESGYEIIGNMVKAGCKPDTITYSTFISGLCRVGRIEEAWGVLDMMEEDNCKPSVRCYTSIVLGYCNEGRIDEAKGLVERMESFGCAPDVVTHTILIDGLCRSGDFDEVEMILGESELKGWKPNEVTYNVYINGLCKAGKIDQAFSQLDVMNERGLCLAMETLHMLFDSLSVSDEELWEVLTLLSWDVDVYFYNTVVKRLCQSGSRGAVLKLLAAMLKRGMLDICTYTIIIHSLCKEKKMWEAKTIFCNMGFEADVVVFNTLLLGFNRACEFNAVHMLLDTVGENITPNEFTYGVVIDSLCREKRFQEAVNYFLESIRRGLLPYLITRPIRWLVKDGKHSEIINLFDEMLRRGFILHHFLFNSLIKAFCKKGFCQGVESDKVHLILDKMLGIR